MLRQSVLIDFLLLWFRKDPVADFLLSCHAYFWEGVVIQTILFCLFSSGDSPIVLPVFVLPLLLLLVVLGLIMGLGFSWGGFGVQMLLVLISVLLWRVVLFLVLGGAVLACLLVALPYCFAI